MVIQKFNLDLGTTSQARATKVTPRHVHPRAINAPNAPAAVKATLPVLTPLMSLGSTTWRVIQDGDVLTAGGAPVLPVTGLLCGFVYPDPIELTVTDATNEYIGNVLLAGQVDGQEVLDVCFPGGGALHAEIAKAVAAASLTLTGLSLILQTSGAVHGFDIVGLVNVR